jgi:hypothetical protein
MTFEFEELDYQKTPLGEISLRRRAEPRLGGEILYEVKLGDEFLMSSLFTSAEIQLARLGLAALEGTGLDIVVGGLGLGYTAVAALEDPAVRSLMVIEVMEPVIDWHRRGLVPLGKELVSDPRCTLVHADFFDVASSSSGGFDHAAPTRLTLWIIVGYVAVAFRIRITCLKRSAPLSVLQLPHPVFNHLTEAEAGVIHRNVIRDTQRKSIAFQ